MIELTEEMKQAIDNALADGNPVVSASVDEDGQPRLAYFGSTQAYSGDQLAIWVRDRSTAFLRRVASNPRITLLYRNPAERQMWQFHGRAQVVDEPDVNVTVFERSPQPERDRDPDRAGVAVIIDLDRVIERREVLMERDSLAG